MAPALVDLRDVQIDLAITGFAVELRAQHLHAFFGLTVFAEQQRFAGTQRQIAGIFRTASLPVCSALGKSLAAR